MKRIRKKKREIRSSNCSFAIIQGEILNVARVITAVFLMPTRKRSFRNSCQTFDQITSFLRCSTRYNDARAMNRVFTTIRAIHSTASSKS